MGCIWHNGISTLCNACNRASGTVFLIVTFFAIRSGRRIREIKVAPIWLFVLILAFILKKEIGLVLILPINILVSNVPQLNVAFKEDNLSDLSLGTWLLSISDGLVWGAYSIIEQDTAIMISGVFQLITSSAVVLLKIIKRNNIKIA